MAAVLLSAESRFCVASADCAESVMNRDLLCCRGPSALLQVFNNIHFPHKGAAPSLCPEQCAWCTAAWWRCYTELLLGVASAGGWCYRMLMIGLVGVMCVCLPRRLMLWSHSWSTSCWTWPVYVRQSSAAGSLPCRRLKWWSWWRGTRGPWP